jgi:hypothetical protein
MYFRYPCVVAVYIHDMPDPPFTEINQLNTFTGLG